MFSSIIRRSSTRAKLYRFYVSLACNNYTLATNQCRSNQSILQCITLKHNISHRNFWNTNKNELTEFLPLMPGNVEKNNSIIAPLLMKITERLTIRPLIDSEFNLREVVETAKIAASRVSIALANQNYYPLQHLVEDSTLKLLELKLDTLNEKQRNLIAMREKDIVAYLPLYLKLIGKSFSTDEKTFNVLVEMNLGIFYLPRYGQVEQDGRPIDDPEVPDLLVANYLFSRNYTQDGGSDWIIKYINVSE